MAKKFPTIFMPGANAAAARCEYGCHRISILQVCVNGSSNSHIKILHIAKIWRI